MKLVLHAKNPPIKARLCMTKTKLSGLSCYVLLAKKANIVANVCIFGKNKGNMRRNNKVTVLTHEAYWGER